MKQFNWRGFHVTDSLEMKFQFSMQVKSFSYSFSSRIYTTIILCRDNRKLTGENEGYNFIRRWYTPQAYKIITIQLKLICEKLQGWRILKELRALRIIQNLPLSRSFISLNINSWLKIKLQKPTHSAFLVYYISLNYSHTMYPFHNNISLFGWE